LKEYLIKLTQQEADALFACRGSLSSNTDKPISLSMTVGAVLMQLVSSQYSPAYEQIRQNRAANYQNP
jgi:hypothetical protein|tara:strand:+ start:260 stop:463 length:204 start_codon:yes stop_codon:yes gene_type:complete